MSVIPELLDKPLAEMACLIITPMDSMTLEPNSMIRDQFKEIKSYWMRIIVRGF